MSNGIDLRWDPYVLGRDDWQIQVVNCAFWVIQSRIMRIASVLSSCNAAFRALPFGQTFVQLFNSSTIWVSRNPETRSGLFGASLGFDITIAQYAFTQPNPAIVVAATLVHEMAHIGGAPGVVSNPDGTTNETRSRMAEATLQQCGFSDQYNPTVLGMAELIERLNALA
jgi:hypothetical protein